MELIMLYWLTCKASISTILSVLESQLRKMPLSAANTSTLGVLADFNDTGKFFFFLPVTD